MDSGMTRQGRIEELLASFAELDARLRRRKLRGHVYLTGKSTVAFAVRTNDAGEVEYLGAGTVEEAITETRGIDAAGDWLTEVGETFGTADRRTVAPAVWNTPHLVVTGAGASHASAAKLRLEQPDDDGGDEVNQLVGRLDLRTVDESDPHPGDRPRRRAVKLGEDR